MKRRYLSILMVLCMVVTLLPTTAEAANSDFTIVDGVLTVYNGPGGDIIIPDSVSTIGRDVFRDCTSLTSVSFPSSLLTVENYAFYGCTGLESVIIPSNVTSIGSRVCSHNKDSDTIKEWN